MSATNRPRRSTRSRRGCLSSPGTLGDRPNGRASWDTLLVVSASALAAVIVANVLAGCSRPESEPAVEKTNESVSIFEDITESAGIDFCHHAGGAQEYFFPAIMCAGAAFLDFDVDGDLDVLLIDGGEMPRFGQPTVSAREPIPSDGAARRTNCRLFRQDAGLRFVDVSTAAGLELFDYGMGAAVGDVNNDGYPDIYVSCFGPDHLFVNCRDGTFRDQTQSAKIENERWAASAVFFDYDRDGWLDLFVTNYVDYDPAQPCLTHNGQRDFCNPAVFSRTADKLFHNVSGRGRTSQDGRTLQPSDVRFEDVSVESGIALKTGAGLGVVSADFNADHWPDLYVANDGHANFLWINQQNGTFREEAVLAGVAYDRLGKGQGSMGIALGDVNADHRLDLLVTNLDGESNALYLAHGDGGFEESSVRARISELSFPRTGFGTVLIDVDLDGDLDLLVANGRVRRNAVHSAAALTPGSSEFWGAYQESNDLLLNQGTGVFQPSRSGTDRFLTSPGIARALVAGDIDNDGDLDLLVTQVNGQARLLQNTGPRAGHWLMVRTVLPQCGGRDAVGATVTVVCGDQRWVSVVAPAASYLSSHDPRLHFGLGATTRIDAIEVVWPDGREERFAGGDLDRLVVIQQGQGESP